MSDVDEQLEEIDRAIARGIESARWNDAAPRIELAQLGPAPVRRVWDTGTKFPGGFGDTQLLVPDYWTLRARSTQLFETNLYARGIIRRFITNVINTGLHLEATPDESVLGLAEDSLADWSELVENRFQIWERNALYCDHLEQSPFGALQAAAYAEALIAGDVLVVLRQDAGTGLPRVQLVCGDAVQTPFDVTGSKLPSGNQIVHGVEIDKFGRHVAYHMRQYEPGSLTPTTKRMPAWGEKSGRRLAWLVYGTEKRLNDVRGKPILSLVLQSLREIDRYRDSTQRKAVINSMLAMFIAKTEDKPGTLPFSAGAVRVGTRVVQDAVGASPRTYNTVEHVPGLILDELQHGEEPKAFQTNGTVENFGTFEEAIVQAFAWALETPPEILRLSFSNNYSASQAAINEYKMFLNRVRSAFGDTFCAPVYVEWLVSEVLEGRIEAPRLIDAWRRGDAFDVLGAWTSSDWAGQIKPAVDLSKLVTGYTSMVEQGFITRDRAARELTGMKYSKVARRLRIENEQLLAARAALVPEVAPAPAPKPAEPAPTGTKLSLVRPEGDR